VKTGFVPGQVVVFLLDDRRYGLRLSVVEKIVQMAEITPLPKAPPIVMGIVNLQGRIIPIFNIRMRFGLEEREPDPNDHLVIANTRLRTVGFIVDEASGTVEQTAGETVDPETILPGIPYIEGVVKRGDGMILIHDLDLFLSIDEETALDVAMQKPPEVEP
jgi:purine-binding chemotaxis protein CheW